MLNMMEALLLCKQDNQDKKNMKRDSRKTVKSLRQVIGSVKFDFRQ